MSAKKKPTDGWTLKTLAAHNEAMRIETERFDDERDRRYTEVNIEKEKALKIKETADLAALSLARESQTYKEQQNDALRDKNLSESGIYATNASVAKAFDDLRVSLQPLVDFVSAAKGASTSKNALYAFAAAIVAVVVVVAWLMP